LQLFSFALIFNELRGRFLEAVGVGAFRGDCGAILGRLRGDVIG
jgi:hypothetical protein